MIVVTDTKASQYLSCSYILTSDYAIQKPPPFRGPVILIDTIHSSLALVSKNMRSLPKTPFRKDVEESDGGAEH